MLIKKLTSFKDILNHSQYISLFHNSPIFPFDAGKVKLFCVNLKLSKSVDS